MKVLLINGSPNEKECTNRGLEEVAKALQEDGIETEIFWIGKNVPGCLDCGKCHDLGHRVYNDGVTRLVEKALKSDGFIFGTPVYYSAPNGTLLSFMQRLFMSGSKALAYKPVATMVSCRRGGASETFAQLNQFYGINSMFTVGSQYWNQIHGNSVADVEKDLEGLQTLRTLGHNMAYLLKCIEAGKKAGVPLPKLEARLRTNFIQ
ncbi:MAG: 2-amino-4-deoxychorismate dehydrogenase [Tenericutes bacterium ADurb.BinA155]|nr:MAG: 2-amino-4-deoxychorismate dehydrogenase [Tenericutes bacterium ADurb.BinA155]